MQFLFSREGIYTMMTTFLMDEFADIPAKVDANSVSYTEIAKHCQLHLSLEILSQNIIVHHQHL